MEKEKIFEIINLTREEVDKLDDAIESLRNFGVVHFVFSEGELTFQCDGFEELRERYKKDLKKIKRGDN